MCGLCHLMNVTRDRARFRILFSALKYRRIAMISSTVFAPSVFNTSEDYCNSLLKLMTCTFAYFRVSRIVIDTYLF